MYEWRHMTTIERAELLLARRSRKYPKHSPPHFEYNDTYCFHLCAANFEHQNIIGATPQRLEQFSRDLCGLFEEEVDSCLYAWCVLPNHWHLLAKLANFTEFLQKIGHLHGKSSFLWNQEDNLRGRKCWHGCSDRRIRGPRHFNATLNYILYNPVKHGYVKAWTQWPFSSIHEYLENFGEEQALVNFDAYPILNMGETWDKD